ncbi:MAG: LapA family protein, partial [Candidatus Sedimenticola endophacoides]
GAVTAVALASRFWGLGCPKIFHEVATLLFASVTLPLSVVLLGAVAFGALLGCLAMLGSLFRLKRENSELVRESRLANQELNNLRSIPIKD